MKTQVIMKRMLFGQEVRQQSKTGMFSATDLRSIGNNWRRQNGLPDFNMGVYLKTKSTRAFIEELEKKYGSVIVAGKGKGRNSNTWVHPLLFIDIALAINPKLKIEVYEWLFDNLLEFRNDSGDSYKDMCGALWVRIPNKQSFPAYIVKVANYIQQACNVKDWQSATPEQLKLRDKIHNSIKTLTSVLQSTDEAVRLGVKEHVNP